MISRLPQVFVSVQHVLDQHQAAFVQEVDRLLVEHGFTPVTIGRTIAVVEEPLTVIRTVIQKSIGTVVIAFNRIFAQELIEYPASICAIKQSPRAYPTVWNQIEAAMTLQIAHPLLVLNQTALYPEGVLDPAIFPVTEFELTDKDQLSQTVEHAILEWLAQLGRDFDELSS